MKAEKGLVVAEEDCIMPTDGVTMMPLIIGAIQFEWPVYVAIIVDELLLGCDLSLFITMTSASLSSMALIR